MPIKIFVFYSWIIEIYQSNVVASCIDILGVRYVFWFRRNNALTSLMFFQS